MKHVFVSGCRYSGNHRAFSAVVFLERAREKPFKQTASPHLHILYPMRMDAFNILWANR